MRFEDYLSQGSGVFIATDHKPCEHGNGWYHNVRFLWWERRFYACHDCASLLPQGGWEFNPK
jgi:hypothetical protein